MAGQAIVAAALALGALAVGGQSPAALASAAGADRTIAPTSDPQAASLLARGRVPGATVLKACAGAGPYWPTMTLTFVGVFAWVACKEESRVIRVDTVRRKTVASVKLDAPVIAVAAGYSSVWALDTSSTLYGFSRPRRASRDESGYAQARRTTSGSAPAPFGSSTIRAASYSASRR